MLAAASDVHTFAIQVCAGVAVVVLVAILTVGRKLLGGQRRIHEALFGFREGEHVEPGIVEIVRGNGKGSLLKVAEDALEQSEANGRATAAVQSALDTHVNVDERRWGLIAPVLEASGIDTSDGEAAPKKPRRRTTRKPAA